MQHAHQTAVKRFDAHSSWRTARKVLLSLAVLPLTATYQLSFLWVPEFFPRAAVLGVSLFIIVLCWLRLSWGVYLFIFSIPLFNTLAIPTEGSIIRGVPWPGVSPNAVLLGAIATAWAFRSIWGRRERGVRHETAIEQTPVDGLMAAGIVLVLAALPLGWVRFNNIAVAGFYYDAAAQFQRIPFFDLLDTYLCFTRAWQFLQFCIAFYLLCTAIRTRDDIRRILWLVAAAGVLVAIYGLFQFKSSFRWVGINWYFRRINATLNGPDSAATYFATFGCLACALLAATQSLWRKALLFLSLTLAAGALWLTVTRTAFYSLAIVGLLFLLVFWITAAVKSKRVRYVSVFAVIGVLLLGPGYELMFPDRGSASLFTSSPQFQRLTEGFRNVSITPESINAMLSFRFYHWSAATSVIRQHPLAGSGLGTFDKYYRLVRVAEDSYKTAFAHSLYLDVLTELGPLALAVLIAFHGVMIVLAWRVIRARTVNWRWKAMALGLLGGIIVVFLTNFFTSSVYYVQELQLWLALLFALLVRIYQLNFDLPQLPLAARISGWWHACAAFCSAPRRAILVGAAAAVAVAAWLFLFWNAAAEGYDFFHSARQYTKLDRILEYGIHFYEYDANRNKFARTARHVYKPIRVRDRFMRLLLRADHPDAREKPVRASVYIDNRSVGSVVLSNRNSIMCRFDLDDWLAGRGTNELKGAGIPAILRLDSSRVWNPFKTQRGKLDVDYGVDMGAIEWGYAQ